jgi:hypothetical protein
MSFVISEPRGAAEIVKNGWRLALESFSRLWMFALAAGLLNSWWGVYADGQVQAGGDFSVSMLLLEALSALLAGLLSLIMLRRLDRLARGSLADLDDEFSAALRALLPFLLASLVYGLACAVGLVVFLAPGIFLLVALGFYYMYLVLEGCGPLAALGRSFRLVEGQWWHAFGVFLLTMLLLISAAAPLILLAAMAMDAQGGLPAFSPQVTEVLLGGVINMLLQPLGLSLSLSLYYELRARKSALPEVGSE